MPAVVTATPLRVALVTTGRFWLVDLARELASRGHKPVCYSLVPRRLTAKHGMPRDASRWLGKYVAPAYLAGRVFKTGALGRAAQWRLQRAVDVAAARVLEPCDVIIGMSGIAVNVLDVARRRYGATVFVERASRHILSQREILDAIEPGVVHVSDSTVMRELAAYELADAITVPSQQVRDSFLERDFSSDRLFVNPFGASSDSFVATVAPGGPPTIIMTGTWCLRKGCDVLTEAWRRLPRTRLMHVGPVAGDVPLPEDDHFTHYDAVPQARLQDFYAQAHVFALASREEGLALVQVQAVAAGLPLVCTDRTGGADLGQFVRGSKHIRVVPPDDIEAFAEALQAAIEHRVPEGQVRDYLIDREYISWGAHCERYLDEIGRRRADSRGVTCAELRPADRPVEQS